MKSKEQILEWLDKQPWKGEFYEAAFLVGNFPMCYNANLLLCAFDWNDTMQGEDVWVSRDDEYQIWYDSTDKPVSWEEYCEQSPIKEGDYFMTNWGEVHPMERCGERNSKIDINIMPKDHCAAFVAYMKLFQLRNTWVKDCDDVNMNYRIIASNCKIDILYCCVPKMGLSFPTQEMADEFAEIFKDLLEVAKPLL